MAGGAAQTLTHKEQTRILRTPSKNRNEPIFQTGARRLNPADGNVQSSHATLGERRVHGRTAGGAPHPAHPRTPPTTRGGQKLDRPACVVGFFGRVTPTLKVQGWIVSKQPPEVQGSKMYFSLIIAVIKIFFCTQKSVRAVHLNYSDSPDPQPTTHPGRPCKLPYKL